MDGIQRIVKEFDEKHSLSGVIRITRDRDVILEEAYGKASIQLDVPNTIDTKFHIASETKMFIAAAALMLEEEGLIQLHKCPSFYLHNLKNLHPGITLHHLLTHTSGLHDIYSTTNLRYEMYKLKAEKEDFLTYLAGQQQLFNPGEQWSYNSTGFILMGYIIEKVSGMKLEDVLQEMFFNPLKMNNTGMDNPKMINPKRAYGHSIEDGTWINAENDKLSMIDAPGELYSTVGDLHKWCEALFKKEILSEKSYEKMFTPYKTTSWDPDLNYGYGWFLGENYRLIGGGTPGFRSEIWQYPKENVTIIMLWNQEKVNSFALFEKIKPLLIPKCSIIRN